MTTPFYPDLGSEFCLDYETTGVSWWKDKVFGIAVANEHGSWYFDIRRNPEAVRWLTDAIRGASSVISHNAKFEAHFTRELTGLVDVPWKCTMVAAALINEHLMAYDLDSLAKKYIGRQKDTEIYRVLADMFGGQPTRNVQMPNLSRAPIAVVSKYAKIDAEVALGLWKWQKEELKAQELEKVWEVEMQLLNVLTDVEYRGVKVDVARAEKAIDDVTVIADQKQRELNQIAGFVVNPNPSKAIERLFEPKMANGNWVLVDGTIADKTEGGKASINAEVLRRMRHPGAKLILDLRRLLKTRDTFLKGHILGYELNGYIHANFNQTKSEGDVGTGTGRLSVNSPALQQIHKRNKEIAKIVRSIFIPDEGQEWHCHDWAQMDFRVASHYIKNPKILQMYRDDPSTDFHQLTANLTGLPRSPTVDVKGNAKQINLGLCFSMGEGKLAREMGLPYTIEMSGGREWLRAGEEAKEIFRKYHENVPGVREFLDKASSVAKTRGYVKTLLGRRIRFPNINFSYKAGGLIFQGTAADALKMKLIEVHDALKGTEARLMLNVHDEFDISAPLGSRDKYGLEVQEIVREFSGIFRVPIMSDLGIGDNWYVASA